MLSSDNGEDLPLPPPPPCGSISASKLSGSGNSGPPGGGPAYPWIQMALPGGGIVSVPLERASSGAGSARSSSNRDDEFNSPPPTSTARVTSASHSSTSAAGALPVTTVPGGGPGSVGSGVTQADLLTVAAGEPVTHFNLDQLLEIVQSFQLDTTMASHDETLRTARDLVLCADLVSAFLVFFYS